MRRSERSVRLRRIVIAFLVLLGLAGILAASPGGGDDGAPADRTIASADDR
jgi:hypothetical protein